MSYDFATMKICPHQVAFERSDLDQIRKTTVKFPRPPSNSNVSVYVDRVKVPSSGLYSYAELPFSLAEPYRIRRGVNDLLYLSESFEPPRFVQLTPGPNVRAKDMALDLQRQIPNLVVEVRGRRVVIRSHQRTAGTAFQFHDPRWTDKTSSLPTTARVLGAYRAVGIVPGRAATGRLLYPGWRVDRDVSSPLVEDRVLIFDRAIPNADPLVELSYVTTARYCRRCHGTQIEFDYSVKDSTYEVVRDTDLLAQEFDKFLITRIGSHWKWNWLGSGLVDKIGGKGTNGVVNVNALIAVDVSQSFSTYQNIKQQQDTRFPQQKVTDAEYPLNLASVDVQPIPEDPTIAIVVATIVSRSRVPVELKRVIGNPSPFDLTAGDPLQALRFRPGEGFLFRG